MLYVIHLIRFYKKKKQSPIPKTVFSGWPSEVRHCGLVGSLPFGTEQAVSSIPGSVGYISHVHWVYDYLGPFGVLWVHMARHRSCVWKSNCGKVKEERDHRAWLQILTAECDGRAFRKRYNQSFGSSYFQSEPANIMCWMTLWYTAVLLHHSVVILVEKFKCNAAYHAVWALTKYLIFLFVKVSLIPFIYYTAK